ncbi:MAG: hypothetical protein DMG97_28840 [Acidobacteria bacterium]|nr:MAG: hypothetical protein DMG97_28840 [Acidobacteriota bacterium]
MRSQNAELANENQRQKVLTSAFQLLPFALKGNRSASAPEALKAALQWGRSMYVEDQPLPNGSWRCAWCRADRAIRRHKI